MLRRSLLAAPLAAAASSAMAQERFPSRPVRMVIPVGVAGVTDIVGRLLADGMGTALGRPVVAENVPGAGSTVGAAAFLRAPADGYSIYIGTNNHSVMKAIYPQTAPDPLTDFIPLALVARQPFVLVVHPDLPARDVPQLLAWLKAQGEAANYGASNTGGTNHTAGELLKQRAGVDFTIVPYRAAAASVQDLVAGRLHLTIDSPTMLLPLIRDGRVRPLAVTTPTASALVPGLPSLAEAGVADYEMTVYQILFARPGTPPEVQAVLREAAQKAIATPSFAEKLANVGCERWPDSSPAAATALLQADIARMTPIVAKMNLNPR